MKSMPLLAAALLLSLTGAYAQDRADIDRTTITGHKELPRVLYIVPWKKPLPGATAARPRTSLLDETLAPVDRDEFRRHLDYRAQLAQSAQSAPLSPSAPTTPVPNPTPAPQEKQP